MVPLWVVQRLLHSVHSAALAVFWIALVAGPCISGAGVVLDLLQDIDVFAPFLPAHLAIHERVPDLELRVYLNGNFSSDMQVVITPQYVETANANLNDSEWATMVQFDPPSMVFDAQTSTHTFAVTPDANGSWTIEYQATVITNDDFDTADDPVVVATQEIVVLAAPKTFSVDDPQWSGVTLVNASFDGNAMAMDSARPPLFSLQDRKTVLHGIPSASCGVYDGNNALYFTGLGDRFACTNALNLMGFEGKLHFAHVYGFRKDQTYDSSGSNLVSCEQVDPGEEVVVSFVPMGQNASNYSAWHPLWEIPLPDPPRSQQALIHHVLSLPDLSMHTTAQFCWRQKRHSSFPIDYIDTPVSKASLVQTEDILAIGEGTDLWEYANFFDQWAIDQVRLEVRLLQPVFAQISPSGPSGSVDVQIVSYVPQSWVEYTTGDGTQDFPTCGSTALAAKYTVKMLRTGYVHAISCLVVNNTVISSFPACSSRYRVQARPPSIKTVLDTSTSVDTWTVTLQGEHDFMRYTIEHEGDPTTPNVGPSCVYGELINSSTGSITLNSNAKVHAISCGPNLDTSPVTSTELLVVSARPPTFSFNFTTTSVSGLFNVTIYPPRTNLNRLGIAWVVDSALMSGACQTYHKLLTQGAVTITVRAADQIQAVACCVDVKCADSQVSKWGPIDVHNVIPQVSMACSRVKPVTKVITIAPVTLGATIRYQVSGQPPRLTCNTGVVYTAPFEVNEDTTLYALSCAKGLSGSDVISATVQVDECCAGLDAYTHPSCANRLLLHDRFETCLDSTKWTALTAQWGGQDVNGGVHAGNVGCRLDSIRNKMMLELRAHGDMYDGTSPMGTRAVVGGDSTPLTIDDRFLEWALPGVTPFPCNHLDRCPARRVGAAISSVLTLNAGVMLLKLQPCKAFGTLSQAWWGAYEDKGSETLQEVAYLPLWKAAMYQARTAPVAPFVHSASAALAHDSTVLTQGFMEVGMQWNASAGRANLYVNGRLLAKHTNWTQSTLDASLQLGVWFPNAVAGSPLFNSCSVLVDEVHVFTTEVAADRWCDFEELQDQDADLALPCVSDSDCSAWVTNNCLMPIYEAVCVVNEHISAARDEAPDKSARFCQFRLEPAIAHTTASRTDMTTRKHRVHWNSVEETTISLPSL
ncbi:TPA: hypothetical protein N0F65_003794 [Lagenidium giganteum]|uniref:Uncharacterized protein n=1 Tax=Lagenidium giganteum TaxID=4803 RepID=A0AAV2Z002_9STRA|nr:TPA: hypothetical protein N0F65_003794 [Lagenidium giganteum]